MVVDMDCQANRAGHRRAKVQNHEFGPIAAYTLLPCSTRRKSTLFFYTAASLLSPRHAHERTGLPG